MKLVLNIQIMNLISTSSTLCDFPNEMWLKSDKLKIEITPPLIIFV